MTGGHGLPGEAFEFYAELEADNSRAWWAQNRDRYEQHVRAPLAALLAALEPEFGAGHLYRPYRDIRFSKDKSPLKDHQGALVEVADAVGYYVQVSASGLMVAGGWHTPQGTQLARFREAIVAGAGAQLRTQLDSLEAQGWQVDGRPLKTRPRGVDPQHPDLDLLRMRALTAGRTYPAEPWMGTAELVAVVRRDWRTLRPVIEWLAGKVDPGSASPSGR
jgi:uncharacterized protein (TIGR02453 family)